MMRKILSLILIILIVISVFLNVLLVDFLRRIQPSNPQEYIVKDFSIADYEWGIKNFPAYGNLTPIDGVEDAAQKGIDLWVKHLTINEERLQYDPINGEPIIVAYDKEADCWLIMGTLPPGIIGAVPTAIIQSNGHIVAVWMN